MTYHPSCANILIFKRGAPKHFLAPASQKTPNLYAYPSVGELNGLETILP